MLKCTADKQAIQAALPNGGTLGINERTNIVRNWLDEYGVLKGIGTKNDKRDQFRVAKGVMSFFDHSQATFPTDAYGWITELVRQFSFLNKSIHDLGIKKSKKNPESRRVLSLSSKALWCKYPDFVPIYDRYALTAISTLTKLYNKSGEYLIEKDCRRLPNGLKSAGSEYDCVDYEVFIRNYIPIFLKAMPKIDKRLNVESYTYSIRVFDKILWAFGSPNHDFPYRGLVYDRWKK